MKHTNPILVALMKAKRHSGGTHKPKSQKRQAQKERRYSEKEY